MLGMNARESVTPRPNERTDEAGHRRARACPPIALAHFLNCPSTLFLSEGKFLLFQNAAMTDQGVFGRGTGAGAVRPQVRGEKAGRRRRSLCHSRHELRCYESLARSWEVSVSADLYHCFHYH